jgi:undecaprenyl diphosphate synthase
VEQASARGRRLNLQIAVDYSSRDAITDAAARWRAPQAPSREAFGALLSSPACRTSPDVDLLIRSGGEKRLSDFLLWESAYAELCFVDTLWPDFGAVDLRAAMADFHRRERRFGGLCGSEPLAAAE